MLQKLSIKTGLTKTELRVIIFLMITLLFGFTYLTFFTPHDKQGYKRFDYSEQDSIFLNSGLDEDSSSIEGSFSEDRNSKSASILELDKKDYSHTQVKKLPLEKSIDLNTADLKGLASLPGVANKTAIRIIEQRKKIGRFKNYNDLLKVRGIGLIKLEKIKKYSYIK